MGKLRGRARKAPEIEEGGSPSLHQETVVLETKELCSGETKELCSGEWSRKKKRGWHDPEDERSGHVKLPVMVNEDAKGQLEVQMAQNGKSGRMMNTALTEMSNEKAVQSSFQQHDKFFQRREKQKPNSPNIESQDEGLLPGRNPKQCTAMKEKQDMPAAQTPTATIQTETQGLPFVKSAVLWQTIESMDIFRKIPQKPHFRLLEQFKESFREGLAVGCMVTFSTLAEKISKLKYSDPRGTIEEDLEVLSDLENLGFDVQLIRDRLNEFLSLKDAQEKFEKQVADIDKEIIKHVTHGKHNDGELEKITKQIVELKDKRSRAISRGNAKEREIDSLRSVLEGLRADLENTHKELEGLIKNPI